MTTEAAVLLDAAFASYAGGIEPQEYERAKRIIENEEGLFVEVYRKKGSRDYIMSFRGTDQALNDFSADANLGWPQYEKSSADIQNLLLEIVEEGGRVDITGHSLGGALAQFTTYHFARETRVSGRGELLKQISLTTWNALGGVWGLERNGGYNAGLVEGIQARHYYRFDDMVSRLGRGHVGGDMLRLDDPERKVAGVVAAHMKDELSQSLDAGTISKTNPWYYQIDNSSQGIIGNILMAILKITRKDDLSSIANHALRYALMPTSLYMGRDLMQILGTILLQEIHVLKESNADFGLALSKDLIREAQIAAQPLLDSMLNACRQLWPNFQVLGMEAVSSLKHQILELGHILIAADADRQGGLSELQIWEKEQRFADDLAEIIGDSFLGHCLPGRAGLEAYGDTIVGHLRQVEPGLRCPLVLDLDGDGVRTLALGSSGVRFDLDADGSPEACGWIAGSDALLVRDRDGDGRIDSGLELFGDHTLLRDGTRAAHGFAALADLDANRDGLINTADAAWGQLGLWRDANSSGVLDAGEWLSLSSQSITALELAFQAGSGLDAQGNDLRLAGHYQRQDGSRRLLADVWLATGAEATATPTPLNSSLSAQPSGSDSGSSALGAAWADIGGLGQVVDLQQALQADSSGRLLGLLNQWRQADAGQRPALLADIALHWAGVADLPSSGGWAIDDRILAALHAFTNNRFSTSNWDLSSERNLVVLRESFQALCRQIGTLLEARQLLSPLWSRSIRLDAEGQPQLDPAGFERALQDQLRLSPNDEQLVAAGQALRSHTLVGGLLMQGLRSRAMENLQQPDRRLWLLQRPRRQPTTDSWIWNQDEDELIEISPDGTAIDSVGGDDVVLGTDQVDIIRNLEGDDLILGFGGDDNISSLSDLIGNGGHTTIVAGLGNDTLTVKGGSHTLIHNLGDGHDSLIGNSRSANNTLILGPGIHADAIRFGRSGADQILDFQSPGQGIRLVNLFLKNDFFESVCALRTIRFHDGSSWTLEDLKDRLLRGDATDNQITGFHNHDRIWGEAGHDNLSGRDGNDTLLGGSGNDTLNGEAGSDRLEGGEGDDQLVARHMGGEDTLLGGSGRNGFLHYRGNVQLAANPADNGSSSNSLELPLIAPEDLTLERQGNLLIMRYQNVSLAGTSTIRVEEFFRDFTVLNRWNPLQFINFGSGVRWDARTLASRFSNSLMGTSADNRLSGRDSDDWLDGMEGHDSLQGLAGHDTLQGGSGNDTLHGGAGNDLLLGGDGVDTASWAGQTTPVRLNLSLSGAQESGAGLDSLSGIENLLGGSGADQLSGDQGANRLEGGDGDDWLDGGDGNDTMIGGNQLSGGDTASYGRAASGVTVNLSLTTAQNTGAAGSDLLSGIEHLSGSAHGDVLIGSSGANRLEGGAGNDTLQGGAGADSLTGGEGADLFLVTGVAEAGNGSGSRDLLLDFSVGDRLDLGAIDARSDQSGNQAFVWIGTAAFSALGQLRYTRLSSGNGLLEGNCSGNLAADFQLELRGAPDLAGGAAVLL